LPSAEADNRGENLDLLKRYRWPIIGVGAVVLLVAFLLFRPDKLFVDDAVNESLADAFPVAATAPATTTTTTPPTTTAAPVETTDEPSTTTTTTTTTAAPEPSGPVAVGTGGFYGIDHSATGTATVYEQGGAHVLRFEDDTDIQNGPDLFVWVLETDSYDGGDPGEFLDLGKIKGNVGGQNYELPVDFDPEVHQFVLIWCKRFSVPFAAAPLV
jgi:hypothetical protein